MPIGAQSERRKRKLSTEIVPMTKLKAFSSPGVRLAVPPASRATRKAGKFSQSLLALCEQVRLRSARFTLTAVRDLFRGGRDGTRYSSAAFVTVEITEQRCRSLAGKLHARERSR